MSQPTRLYIPPRTLLQTVWYVPSTHEWQMWTSVHDRNAPFTEMLGTALVVREDGSAARLTIRPDDTINVMEVMPPCK